MSFIRGTTVTISLCSVLLTGCAGGVGEALLAKKVWDELTPGQKQALMNKNPFRQQSGDTAAAAAADPDARRLQSLLLEHDCDVGVADGYFGRRSKEGLTDFGAANPDFLYDPNSSYSEIASNLNSGEWQACNNNSEQPLSS